MKTCNGLGVPDDVIQAERTLSKWAAENNLEQWKIGCAQSRVDDWQPIETAPKDGTPILIHCPNSRRPVQEVAWHIPYEGATQGCWQTPWGPVGRGYIILESSPKHWMPLPPPPKESE